MHKDVVKLAIDTYKGSLGEFSKEDANEALRKALVEINGGSEKIDYKSFRRNKLEIFEIVEQALDVVVADYLESQFGEFVEIRNVALGDAIQFNIKDNSLFKVAVVSDGTSNLRRQRIDKGSLTVDTKIRGVKIYEEMTRFLAGRIDWVEMVNRVASSYNAQIATEIYQAIYNAYNTLGATYAVTGNASEDEVGTLVQHVESANNAEAVIIGTKVALRKIAPSVVSDAQKGQRNELGFYAMVNGVELREIRQVHKPGTDEFAIDDSFVLVLPKGGEKLVKLVIEGDSVIKETENQGDFSMEYLFLKKSGIAVLSGGKFGIYRIS